MRHQTQFTDAERSVQSPTPMSVLFHSSDHSRPSLSKTFYSNAALSKVALRDQKVALRDQNAAMQKHAPLYTPDERARRDSTRWTLVQGVLAPLQFLAFTISVCLVLRYLVTGDGLTAATISILIKTLLLFSIMVTGAIWEKIVFGRYLFAPAFFWEDVFSMLVIALHTAYCIALFGGYGSSHQQMAIALAAYCAYAINATQFLLKLRAARLDQAVQAKSNLEAVQ
jgi:3-vinyl bacteriochlorophyllide hydratase